MFSALGIPVGVCLQAAAARSCGHGNLYQRKWSVDLTCRLKVDCMLEFLEQMGHSLGIKLCNCVFCL